MSDEGVIDYADWGSLFFATAVTTERVLAGVNAIAGQPIDVGPLGVGPGRMAKVTARGEIGTATGERTSDDPIAFTARLPVPLEFSLDLGVDVQRFTADIVIPLRLVAYGRDDLAIVIEVEPPSAREVTVQLKAKGLRASIVQHAADVEGELQRFVAKYVGKEIEKPTVQEARVIDVGAAIDRAAGALVPRAEGPEVAQHVSTTLAAEIEQDDDLFGDETAIRKKRA